MLGSKWSEEPTTIEMSASPSWIDLLPIWNETKEDEQAVSMVTLAPCRS